MSAVFFSIALVVFMVFIAPIWLFLFYRNKRQAALGLNQEDVEKLRALHARAEKLNERVLTLERILDAESPNWRG